MKYICEIVCGSPESILRKFSTSIGKRQELNLEHCADGSTQRMIDKSKIEVTSHLDEGCDTRVVGGER